MKTPTAGSGIYAIMNLSNQKLYIGSSFDIKQRIQRHRSCLRKNYHQNARLQNSYNKHGESTFFVFVLEYCSHSLSEREQYWIDILRPEYNFTIQVIRNTISSESVAKMAATLKRRYADGSIVNARKGVKASPETLEKMRIASTGRPKSAETIEKHRAKVTGIKRTEEQRIKGALACTNNYLLSDGEREIELTGIKAVINYLGISNTHFRRLQKMSDIVYGYTIQNLGKGRPFKDSTAE